MVHEVWKIANNMRGKPVYPSRVYLFTLFVGEGDGTHLETEPPKLNFSSHFGSQQWGRRSITSFPVPWKASATVRAGTGPKWDGCTSKHQRYAGQVPGHEGTGLFLRLPQMLLAHPTSISIMQAPRSTRQKLWSISLYNFLWQSNEIYSILEQLLPEEGAYRSLWGVDIKLRKKSFSFQLKFYIWVFLSYLTDKHQCDALVSFY